MAQSKYFEINYDQGDFRLSKKGNFMMFLTLEELYDLGQLIVNNKFSEVK